MKKSLISIIIILVTLSSFPIQAGGKGQGNRQGSGQRQGNSSVNMKREQSRTHQQNSGQYQQNATQEQRRTMNRNSSTTPTNAPPFNNNF
jgi:hypothetical protein